MLKWPVKKVKNIVNSNWIDKDVHFQKSESTPLSCLINTDAEEIEIKHLAKDVESCGPNYFTCGYVEWTLKLWALKAQRAVPLKDWTNTTENKGSKT